MLKIKSYVSIIVFTLLILFSISVQCYGNSAEPPSILIIVPNAPDNLEITIGSGDAIYEAKKVDKIIETYYQFYSSRMFKLTDYALNINIGDDSYRIYFDKPLKNYNNIFTLNLNSKTITEGKLLTRSILLVTMRVTLTLAIEGIIFFIFGFRNKKSWIAFIVINLITQGSLNIWINGFMPTQSYTILGLILGEFIIFIVEIIGFLYFVKEHNKLRTVLYVLVANLLSLIAGGYIITILPI